MKKFLGIVLLILFWNSVANAKVDLFDYNKSLDYNFICVAPHNALKNDWSDIRSKVGFAEVESQIETGPRKVLLYAFWNSKYNSYDKISSAVKIRNLNNKDMIKEYIWHGGIYDNVKSKNGEKVPMILTKIMTLLKGKKKEWFHQQMWIEIPRSDYNFLNLLKKDLKTIKDEKDFIKNLQHYTSAMETVSLSNFKAGNLDQEFEDVCKEE
tara:strand:- start:75 stop:704 length:630 start_codon:yes stop_codon:yes gene_type:complete